MIISVYRPTDLVDAFGIDMSTIDMAAPGDIEVGAGWGRVAPGTRSDSHQHDEIEVFVITAGTGELVVDGVRHPVSAGTVARFEPFETHVLKNIGDTDLVFVTFYWRDLGHAAHIAADGARPRRFGDRPVFVFSTPPTPNGDLHLGHLSGPYLGADVFVRFQRMNGARAWHLTGSDDFQSYVVAASRDSGATPPEVAAHYSAEIAETLKLMDIEPDQYTVPQVDPTYPLGLQAYFSRLVASGAVRPRTTPALFDGETGEYLYEVDVTGGCPGCGEETGGNICEDCGEPNVCVDLVDPASRRSNAPVRQGEITRLTLPLHEFAKVVAEHQRVGRVPVRLRELAERIYPAERFDLPLTHPASWGVPAGPDQQVVWAWPEMSYGFLHGIEALGRRLGEKWRADEPGQDWKVVHFFGYDNSFYHSVLYPVLYRLAFPDWEPDIDYHVNEFYLLDGTKFSTSRRHAVWGKDVLGPDTVDGVRFHLSLTRPEAERTNFGLAACRSTIADTLVGVWQRWLTDLGERVATRFGSVAPDAGTWSPEHTAFLARLGVRLAAVTASLTPDGFSLNQAADELNRLAGDAARFAAMENAGRRIPQGKDGPCPAIAKAEDAAGPAIVDGEVRSATVEGNDEARTAIALELAAAKLLALCAAPVMPRFARRLSAALGEPEPARWPDRVSLVPPGTRIGLAGHEFFQVLP